jgi:N-methylhydantoinase A/oxoprolinase/acetone carboxylase beta subunit
MHGCQFWIDVGGTFTDCIGKMPDGRLLRWIRSGEPGGPAEGFSV